jgi:hypothetical protein
MKRTKSQLRISTKYQQRRIERIKVISCREWKQIQKYFKSANFIFESRRYKWFEDVPFHLGTNIKVSKICAPFIRK